MSYLSYGFTILFACSSLSPTSIPALGGTQGWMQLLLGLGVSVLDKNPQRLSVGPKCESNCYIQLLRVSVVEKSPQGTGVHMGILLGINGTMSFGWHSLWLPFLAVPPKGYI